MQTIDLKQTKSIDLSDLFNQLLHYRDGQSKGGLHANQLGLWLHRQLILGTISPLPTCPFESGTYTRTYIGKESPKTQETPSPSSMFESLVMRWDKHAQTSIHGHPQFSFYHVISGVFEIERFEKTAMGNLYTQEIQQLLPAKSTWFLGQSHCYDNCIHRVTCVEPGLTFHVYSDDALKGVVFTSGASHSN